MVGIRVEQGVEVPAAVGGEGGDAVGGGGDEVPEVVGVGDAAGVAAGHADDGDGFVVGGAGGGVGGVGGGGVGGEEFGFDVVGEEGGVGVVEDEGGGEAEAGDGVEAVAEFDGGEGVEAEFGEGAFGGDGVGCVVAEDGGDLGADGVEEEAGAFGGGEGEESLGEGGGVAGAGLCGAAAGGADEAAQQCGHGRGLAEGRQVQPDRRHRRNTRHHTRIEQAQALFVRERRDTAPTHLLRVGGSQLQHAAIGPGAPGEGGGGQTGGVAVGGEGVEEGVGGGVVRLTCRTQHTRRGGVEDEEGEVQVGGQLVQVPGGVRLGPQHRGQPLGGQ